MSPATPAGVASPPPTIEWWVEAAGADRGGTGDGAPQPAEDWWGGEAGGGGGGGGGAPRPAEDWWGGEAEGGDSASRAPADRHHRPEGTRSGDWW